jgi:hypothetical protein
MVASRISAPAATTVPEHIGSERWSEDIEVLAAVGLKNLYHQCMICILAQFYVYYDGYDNCEHMHIQIASNQLATLPAASFEGIR